MSLPPELHVLCRQLSSTPADELPRIVPSLVQLVLRCQNSLSTISKANSSTASVLVHKLKTQISTLLNGKITEGRFTAVVLVKAIIEIGEWEALKSSESWIRALIGILGKPDPAVTKELCIVALTKIYIMTHQYQTLVREITTSTLPAYVTSCLNILLSKSSSMTVDLSSLREAVLRSFILLVPLHASIFRPFDSQIRQIICSFIAPTGSQGLFVTSSVKESARRLFIGLYQTTPKGGGGDEWSKAIGGLIRSIHLTTDRVFRAVDEDWESTTGYLSEPVDLNEPQHGGGENTGYSPTWVGIEAGADRLVGLLEFLAEYFYCETPGPVTIPLGAILDMVRRFLSLVVPPAPELSGNGRESRPLNQSAGKEELDILRIRIPHVYIAVMQLLGALADRLQNGFVSIAWDLFDLLVWVFPNGEHIPEFRLASFRMISRILLSIGKALDQAQTGKLSVIIKSCVNELYCDKASSSSSKIKGCDAKPQLDGTKTGDVNKCLQRAPLPLIEMGLKSSDICIAASKLLPLFISHIPQQFLHISIRSTIERAAILSKNQDTMLACVLNPFTSQRGQAIFSVIPHLNREFASDDITEMFLRPRMPLIPQENARPSDYDDHEKASGEEDYHEPRSVSLSRNLNSELIKSPLTYLPPQTLTTGAHSQKALGHECGREISKDLSSNHPLVAGTLMNNLAVVNNLPASDHAQTDVLMSLDDTSDDESVHLTMQMDTDSESGGK